MQCIAFAPRHNTKRVDATGAFQPEAKRFLDYWHADVTQLYLINNLQSQVNQRNLVLDILQSKAGAGGDIMVAFFCHGFKSGIQLGFRLGQADDLAQAIAALGDVHVRVPLYACDCARDLDRDRMDDLEALGGDGGFADVLRDALTAAGAVYARVDAHTTAGHTSRNPNVRRFDGDGMVGPGPGGYYLIPHGDPQWKAWRQALRGTMRFEYPGLTQDQIRERLAV